VNTGECPMNTTYITQAQANAAEAHAKEAHFRAAEFHGERIAARRAANRPWSEADRIGVDGLGMAPETAGKLLKEGKLPLGAPFGVYATPDIFARFKRAAGLN
jgi:hypothetical protein